MHVLGSSWGVQVEALEYLAVGFGSFHWRPVTTGEQWFVSVDDLEDKKRYEGEPVDAPLQRLTASLETAWSLRRAGMGFIVAPIRTSPGAIVETLGTRFAVALYPFVEGTSYTWGSYPTRGERLAILDILVELHSATELARPTAFIDDFTIARREQLITALVDVNRPWTNGPFGERARELVGLHAEAIRSVLELHDRLASIAGQSERMVVTHGEPHRANTITTANGIALIDWDTLLIAPPERDLWSLASEDPSMVEDYEARTGTTPRHEIMDLYQLSWDISEVAIYVHGFRQSHGDTQDTRFEWESLQGYADAVRRWAEL